MNLHFPWLIFLYGLIILIIYTVFWSLTTIDFPQWHSVHLLSFTAEKYRYDNLCFPKSFLCFSVKPCLIIRWSKYKCFTENQLCTMCFLEVKVNLLKYNQGFCIRYHKQAHFLHNSRFSRIKYALFFEATQWTCCRDLW